MTDEEAIAWVKQTAEQWRQVRHRHDAAWTMNLVYDTGDQWGRVVQNLTSASVRSLKEIVDPNRMDVRATLDITHQNVIKKLSVTNPQRIAATVWTRSSQTYGRTCEVVLEKWLDANRGKFHVRAANHIRIVLGAGIVRRTISAVGGPRQPGQVGRTRIGWSECFPWEIVRDPSAMTTNPFDDEEIIGQEKPRTLAWLKANFGLAVESKTTMGDMASYQDDVISAALGKRISDLSLSKQKAVMVGEWCFKTDEGEQPWAKHMLTWRDPRRGQNVYNAIPLGGGGLHDNPFDGLPWSFLWYDKELLAAWPRGLPHMLFRHQDMFNSSLTWLQRAERLGLGKMMIDKSTVEGTDRMMDNDPFKPTFYRLASAYQKPPYRESGPQIPATATHLAGIMPEMARGAAGLAGVQFGEPSGRRGDSGISLEKRLDQADSIIEDMRTDDEDTLSLLLRGTLIDVIRHYTLDDLAELVGPDVGQEQLLELKRSDPAKEIESVPLHPASLRPKTQADVQDQFIQLARNMVIPAEQAQYEMWEQGRVNINSPMTRALAKQDAEIQFMLRTGQYVQPSIGEGHSYHIIGARQFIDGNRWHDVPEDRKQIILEHLIGHMTAMREEQMGIAPPQGQPSVAGQPSPPGTPPQMAAAGSVGPGVNA